MARKEKRYHYLYKTTNILTRRYYYGMHSTDNLGDDYLGSGKRLRYSINKYGKENHQQEIIEFCSDRNSLIDRERKIVNLNEIAKVDCMNLKVGGEGGFISKKQQIHRSSCGGKARAKKLKNDIDYRKKVFGKISKAQKENWKNGVYINKNHVTFLNKKHTKKTKKKMSESHKNKGCGKNNSQYNTCWITNGFQNKKIKKNEINNYNNIEWELGRIYN